MKAKVFISTLLLLCTLTVAAKKVTVTIDGFVPKHQEKVCIIVNEDRENIMEVPVTDGRFTVKLKVDANAFIRIYEGGYLKDYPDRAYFILIPDSKHITVNTTDPFNYTIEGSKMSKKLQECIADSRQNSAEGFHIDVFSDNPDDWAKAREREQAIREKMMQQQREDINRVVNDNRNSPIAVWLLYIYGNNWEHSDFIKSLIRRNPKWEKHPLLQQLLAK